MCDGHSLVHVSCCITFNLKIKFSRQGNGWPRQNCIVNCQGSLGYYLRSLPGLSWQSGIHGISTNLHQIIIFTETAANTVASLACMASWQEVLFAFLCMGFLASMTPMASKMFQYIFGSLQFQWPWMSKSNDE